jgi:hypothetical protein
LINAEVQMRLTFRITRITACCYSLAGCYAIAGFYCDSSLFEMTIESNRAVIMLNENVIMLNRIRFTAVIGHIIPDLPYYPGPSRDNVVTDGHPEVIGELVSMTPVRITIALD